MQMDLDTFVPAFETEENIAEGIGSADVSDSYAGFDGDEESAEDTPEPQSEAERLGAAREGEEGEAAEVALAEGKEAETDEATQPEPKPEATGDKVADGQAKAMWASREAVRKEKEARLALEKELAYIKGQLSSHEPEEAPDTPEVPDREEFDYTNLEEGFDKRFNTLQAYERRVEQNRKIQEWQELAEASAHEARQEYEDYDTVEAAFAARMKTPEGQHLKGLLFKQSDPAEWLYRNQKRYDARQNKPNPEVEALRAELAEVKKKLNEGAKPPAKKSLARARGAGARPQVPTGPQTQDEAFDDVFSK